MYLTENWYEQLMANKSLVDIIIGGFHLTYQRSTIYDYLYPYFIDQTSIMTITHNKPRYNADQLLNPFDTYTWWAILFFLFLLPLWSIIISHLDPNSSKSILDSCSIWLYILLKQNVLNRLKHESRPTIIVSTTWIFATFLLTTIYGNYLLSMISIPHVYNINSLRRLSRHCQQDDMIVLIENNTTTMSIVQVNV